MLVGAAQTVNISLALLPSGPVGIVALLLGGALVLAIAGCLTLVRRRRNLVQRLLGVTSAAVWALALTFLSRGDSDRLADGLLTVAVMCGEFLLVTVLFAEFIVDDQ